MLVGLPILIKVHGQIVDFEIVLLSLVVVMIGAAEVPNAIVRVKSLRLIVVLAHLGVAYVVVVLAEEVHLVEVGGLQDIQAVRLVEACRVHLGRRLKLRLRRRQVSVRRHE